MIYRQPRENEHQAYEDLAEYPLQSTAWGNFREEMGIDVERLIGFDDSQMVSQAQVFFHPIPKLPYTIGNFPRGRRVDWVMLQALKELGSLKRAIFIKIEPNVATPQYSAEQVEELRSFLLQNGCEPGRAFFTPFTFVLDLTKSEEKLLEQMKPKTRYNIKVAEKYGVEIVEDSSEQGFEDYLNLLKLTIKRQQFYAHTDKYQRTMWQHMRGAGNAKVMKAMYQGEVIVAWVLFKYKDTLYYPYGASSRKHRKVMGSNKMMWEVIRLGKLWECTQLDMWGCLGPKPDPEHPWYGFHTFKEGFGGTLSSYVGSFDLVIDPSLYKIYRVLDRWRWRWLKIRRKLPF
jgi:lipid II:glycine glycyltransferase (peptidoglycan interpeptide bridge formation enzyme)